MAGPVGCSDERSDAGGGTLWLGVGHRDGAWVGIRLSAAPAATAQGGTGSDLYGGGVLRMAGPELWDMRRRHPFGYYRGAARGAGAVGMHPWATAQTYIFPFLEGYPVPIPKNN